MLHPSPQSEMTVTVAPVIDPTKTTATVYFIQPLIVKFEDMESSTAVPIALQRLYNLPLVRR